MGGFLDSELVKNFEKGKLPEVETAVSFDIETVAISIMLVLIAFIIGYIVYKNLK